MILTCPQCATRYEVDAAKFPLEGRNVRCAKCANVWHEPGPVRAPPAAEPVADDAPAPREPEPPEAPEPVPEAPERAAYVPPEPHEAAEHAEDSKLPAPPKKGVSWGLAAGWAGLAALVLIIAAAAVSYREDVAALWPQAATLYSSIGLNVNARGIAFTDVGYKRETQDGQPVLAVTGKLVNVSAKELPVPEIRVALMDGDRHELYHWNFAATVATLKPGQEVPFLTRLSSPPAGAKHLQVRFAGGGN